MLIVADQEEANSTEYLGKVIEMFIHRTYPQCTSTVLNSGAGLFQHQANMVFIHKTLRPLINRQRAAIVEQYAEDWSSHFHLTFALSDGPHARMAQLTSGLRQYRPDLLHIWQLKGFWHHRQLRFGDIDVEPFVHKDSTPSEPVKNLSPEIKDLVNEIAQYKKEFEDSITTGESELSSFWLRKTGKPVLSVLMVSIVILSYH